MFFAVATRYKQINLAQGKDGEVLAVGDTPDIYAWVREMKELGIKPEDLSIRQADFVSPGFPVNTRGRAVLELSVAGKHKFIGIAKDEWGVTLGLWFWMISYVRRWGM